MLRRKLVLHLLIIVLCGTVILSVPVIADHLQKSTQATDNQSTLATWVLVSVYVGDRYQNMLDAIGVWQIEKRFGDTVVAQWEEIYAAISPSNPLIYDDENLTLSPYGLIYRSSAAALTGYTSTVTYQGRTCVLKFK